LASLARGLFTTTWIKSGPEVKPRAVAHYRRSVYVKDGSIIAQSPLAGVASWKQFPLTQFGPSDTYRVSVPFYNRSSLHTLVDEVGIVTFTTYIAYFDGRNPEPWDCSCVPETDATHEFNSLGKAECIDNVEVGIGEI
jgi:hypothetical protein